MFTTDLHNIHSKYLIYSNLICLYHDKTQHYKNFTLSILHIDIIDIDIVDFVLNVISSTIS